RARRRDRHGRDAHQAGAAAGHCRRRLRARSIFSGPPRGLLHADTTEHLQDGANPSSLRIDWLERAESHHALCDHCDHLRAVQFDDAEAALMSFSVEGKKVTVAGAARSGKAAAELLARRGARVTLSDATASVDKTETLQQLG